MTGDLFVLSYRDFKICDEEVVSTQNNCHTILSYEGNGVRLLCAPVKLDQPNLIIYRGENLSMRTTL